MYPEPERATETSTGARLRRAAARIVAPIAAILLPDRHLAPEVRAGRYAWPLLLIVASAALAALAIGARLDLGPEVRAEHAGVRPATVSAIDQPITEVKTDLEIAEETADRTAVARVMLGLEAGLKTPARVVLLALCLFGLGRYVGGTPTMARAMAAASLVALPGAVRSIVTAVAAWHQPAIGSAEIDQLVSGAALPVPAGHLALERLLGGVDLFTCWAALLLGFALAASAELPRLKALLTAVVGLVLYLLVTGLIMGGGGPPSGSAG